MIKLSSFLRISRTAQKVSALCGMVIPVWYIAIVSASSLLRPGYDQVSHTISELGVGRFGALMDTGFLVVGLLVLAAGLGLRRGVAAGRASGIGFVLLVVYAAGNVIDAFFTCDPGCPLSGSFHQTVHNVTAIVAFIAVESAPLPFSKAFKADVRWQRFTTYSAVSGALGIFALLIFIVAELSFSGLIGITQRLLIAVPVLWIGVVSANLWRIQP